MDNKINNIQEVLKVLDISNNILVVFNNDNSDILMSSVCLSYYLKKLQKSVDLISENQKIDSKYEFLNITETIEDKLKSDNKFTIIINTKENKAKELSYEPKENSIEVYLSGENRGFEEKDITFIKNDKSYDLIITLGVSDIKNLSNIYDENVDLFYNIPIINIDNNISNERFGQINLIEPQYRTLSELIFDMISQNNPDIIDTKISDLLLTGIIDKTSSFKFSSITPNIMSTSSMLIEIGADRENIIKNLYRTKTVSSLKLWGKVLSNMKYKDSGILWSFLTEDEKNSDNISNFKFNDIFNELVSEIPKVKIALLFIKKENLIEIQVITTKKYNAFELTEEFKGVGSDTETSFAISSNDLDQVISIIIEKISKKINN
jgi:phosphoesterase RecJ-like protein